MLFVCTILLVNLIILRSVFSIVYNETTTDYEVKKFNDQLLKSTLSTCQFSVGLYSMFDQAWTPYYLQVQVGTQTPIRMTLTRSDSNPTWTNINVNTGQTISALFTTDDPNPPMNDYLAGFFYSVTNGPNGSGDTMYSSLPITAYVANTCLDECQYSIYIFARRRLTNSWSASNYAKVYLNGQLYMDNIYMPDPETLEYTVDFPTLIRSTDVITVERPAKMFAYMGYSVYSEPSSSGQILYELVNQHGPRPIEWITNYCGENNQLGIEAPGNYYLRGSQIPVTVSKYIQSNRIDIKVFLVCGVKVYTVMDQIQNDPIVILVDIPMDFYGACYLYSSPVDYQLDKFENSINLPVFIGSVPSPFGGDLTFIPPSQRPSVSREFFINIIPRT